MSLFHNRNQHLLPIKENPFNLERDIQSLIETNLSILFNLQFVASEFQLNNLRIDTLAFDPDTKSFVIIEYKRKRNFSVIDQGYAYLSLMLNNKADFILEFNENQKKSLRRGNVDWSQSKVIFIAPSFTRHQTEAINFKDLPIELWEVKRYSSDIIHFQQIQTQGSVESIKTISSDETVQKVSKEVKVYSESDHISKGSASTQELYEKFKEAILELGDLKVKAKKLYVSFEAATNVVDVEIQKRSLKMHINLRKGELDDTKGLTRDVSEIGHYGNGDYEVQVSDDTHLEYILSLIKQVYLKQIT